jgi:hypothetical protein
MTWQPIPIVGGSAADDARLATPQETINWLPVKMERPGGRSDFILRSIPGMDYFTTVGDGPIRGDWNVEGAHYVVSGTRLYRVAESGAATEIGVIPGSNRVSMTHTQQDGGYVLAVFNGPQGFTYTTSTDTFAEITDEGFPGFRVAGFIDSYIAGIEKDGLFAAHSDLANAREYNTVDQYEAEAAPDLLVGQIIDHGEWWLMGGRTIEVYANTGATTGTFQRIPGSTIERGLAAPFAVAKLDNSVFLLGDDGIAYRASGYSLVRISTQQEEQQFAKCDLSQAFAFTYEDRGHKVFYLTFPDGATHGYDVASGEWHKRHSYGLSNWRIATLTRVGERWIAGDRFNGRLYELDWDAMQDDGGPLVSERITGILHQNGDKLVVDGIMLQFDTGRPQRTSGQWQPISLSNLDYEFTPETTATLVGGVVSFSGAGADAGWQLQLPSGAHRLRITAVEFGGAAGSDSAELTWSGGSQANESGEDDSFSPSPFEISAASGALEFGFSEEPPATISYAFLIEVFTQSLGDHHVQMRVSRDGGYTWGNWQTRSIGPTGKFAKPVIFRRQGVSRQWAMHIRVSSPVKRDLLAASIMVRGGG